MILRRLAEHLKQQNWAAIGIELVIVVVGVFLGIQVSNWNDGRKRHQQEIAQVRELSSNLANAIDTKADWIADLERRNRDLVSGVAVVQGVAGDRALTRDECLGMWQAHIITSTSNSAALLALLSADRLDLISDPALHSALRDFVNEHARSALAIDRIERFQVNLVDGYPDAFPRRLVRRDSGESEVACRLPLIRDNQALQNRLLGNLERRRAMIGWDKEVLARMKSLQQTVASYKP